METVMVNDNDNGGFSFIWTIENFTYNTDLTINSPEFTVNILGDYKLSVMLMSMRGNKTVFKCFLKSTSEPRRNVNLSSPANVHYALSIRLANGTYKKVEDGGTGHLTGWHVRNLSKFSDSPVLPERGPEGYLTNNDVTIRVRIWRHPDDLSTSEECYARTKIGIEKVTYKWSTEMDGKSLPSELAMENTKCCTSGTPSFTVDLMSGSKISDTVYLFKMKQTVKKELCFSTCELSSVDIVKTEVCSVRDEHWFDESKEHIWEIPYVLKSKSDIGTLFFHCEFVVSSGIEFSKLEKTGCSIFGDHTENSDSPITLRDCLNRLEIEGKFSDLVVRTPNRDFPVHRSILCARSPVFAAMLEGGTKERRTNVVVIKELDEETVAKMLHFIYADTVEDDLNLESAKKLVYAAELYGIEALKTKCVTFLREYASSVNKGGIQIITSTNIRH